ncbi:hypothetical protein AOLI_G00276000 [Acnodon oligacanthus]
MGELLQLDQQIRALIKQQTELHEQKTHLEAGWEHQRGHGKRSAWVLEISKHFPGALSKHGDIGTIVIHAGRGSKVFSRLYMLHYWLQGWCKNNGIGYVINWSAFWERPAFYRRDGLQPSHCKSVIFPGIL